MLALLEPPRQEANTAVFVDDFLVSVRVGISPATAVLWGEDHGRLQPLPSVALGRKSDGQLLETAGWLSLERWARQRSNAGPARSAPGHGVERATAKRNKLAQGRIHPREGVGRAHTPGCPGKRT
mmetsp:Transcript_23590/g.53217  ORF Transcript_23590/g.53217 Transcript_23590/m.53217 type:complete len:125 (+) Transcript_23590:423-797(+)